MGNIARGTKAYGTTQFATERAAAPGNKAPILSAEVDLDFNTLYQAWNDGIDITDLKPGFMIGHANLGVDAVESNNIKNGTIALVDMGPNSVDSSKIVNGSITDLDLGTDSVTTIKIKDKNVTKGKLEVGAAIWAAGGQRRVEPDPGIPIVGRREVAYLTANAIQARAGGLTASLFIVRAYVHGVFSAVGTDGTIVMHLMRDGSQIDSQIIQGQGNNALWSIYYENFLLPIDLNPHNYTIDVSTPPGLTQAVLKGGSLTVVINS